MKGIILLLSLCLTASIYAGNGKYAQKHASIDKVTIEKKIQKPQTPLSMAERANASSSNSSRIKTLSKVGGKKSEQKKDVTNGWLDFGNVKAYSPKNTDTKERLDSIVMTNSTGERVSHQEFFFDENQWTIGRVNSLWDPESQAWIPIEKYTFVWDEDGYLLTQTGINVEYDEGERKEFTYNDRKLGISQITSILVDGKWCPIGKGEYKYDEDANIIEELISGYDEDEKTWKPALKTFATYSKTHKTTSYEGYSWNGTEWDGVDKSIYAYDENDSIILYGFSKWQPETKDWLYFHKFEQEFKNGKVTKQEQSYWNKTEKSWIGLEEYNGEIIYSGKTAYTYDERGRETYQIYSRYEKDGWKKKADQEGVWSTLETGQQQLVRKAFLYSEDSDSDKRLIGELTQKYNVADEVDYAFEKLVNVDVEQYVYEEEYYYDKDGYFTGSTFWVFSEDNMKMADISEEYLFDANHNVIDSYYKVGQNTGENDWINLSRFTYAYENNVRTEKLCYAWDNENKEWKANWGEGVKFDLSVPFADLIAPIGYLDVYKVLATYSLTGVDREWDTNTFTYCYSDQNVTSIVNQADNSTFTIYPNPVVDILYINSTDNTMISMYNLQGAKLLQTNEKKIDMSGYPAGLYIIEVNGVKTKVLKK